ncbi:ABC transporter permease [Christensenellaceae bacterium]|nr:ABC transporter permease [Christensenellaceae bacterium]BDF60192.1 ABC transporter permease [Christensenellaceae bacterium]
MQSKGANNQGGTLTKPFHKKTFYWHNYIVYIAFALVVIVFGILINDRGFLTINNFMNIIRQTTMVIVMGVAMTFVMASGEIDLSVGSTTAFAGLLTAMALQSGVNVFVAILIGLSAGLIVGSINAVCVALIKIPSFLVTLGTMMAFRGVDMWLTNTSPVPILNEEFITIFGAGNIGPIPTLLLWSIAVTIVGHFVLKKTKYGRKVLATGGNRTSAKYSGINTKKIIFSTFIITGLAAALAGLLYSGLMASGRYNFGDGDEMDVLAAVIMGGTAFSGGRGSIIGTVVGALLISTINNALILFGLEPAQQMVVSGAVIIVAVALGRKNS